MRRLRTRAQFQALLGQPPVARTAHFALHRLNPVDPALFDGVGAWWLGAMAPKRWARRAVTRNSIRRQIYSVGQTLRPPSSTVAYLVRLRAEFSRAQFPSADSIALRRAVREELLRLFARGAD